MKKIFKLSFFLIVLSLWACEKEQAEKYVPNEIDEQLLIRMIPTATFDADTNAVLFGRPISFNSINKNNPVSWLWDFGDGNVSIEQNPKYFYKSAGEYTVSLTVENPYGQTTYAQALDVNLINDPSVGLVKDIVGNTYFTKKIGTQTWMIENLRTTYYNDGTPIQKVEKNSNWGIASTAYCWYENDKQNSKYGALYNKSVVNTGKISPVGWHVASVDEWETLIEFLGGKAAAVDYLFSLQFPIETGSRNTYGNFGYLESLGQFWTDNPSTWTRSWGVNIEKMTNDIDITSMAFKTGLGIRCIKN